MSDKERMERILREFHKMDSTRKRDYALGFVDGLTVDIEVAETENN